MSLWGLNKKPTFLPNAIATARGWVDPSTGEIVVAISQLEEKRHDFLDDSAENLLLEDGGLFLLEPNIGDEGPDFLVLDL